jgi:hypothetical protein
LTEHSLAPHEPLLKREWTQDLRGTETEVLLRFIPLSISSSIPFEKASAFNLQALRC